MIVSTDIPDKSPQEIRFSGINRLYGDRTYEILSNSHVLVVGCGGVGSWTVEALARTGLGELTLVDPDEVCLSNTNRQLVALTTTVGKPKIEVLRERVLAINPECKVNLIQDFYSKDSSERIFSVNYDYVIDAIDMLTPKCHLIATARSKGIGVCTVGGSGGRHDPTNLRTGDLGVSFNDKLLMRARKKLRDNFGFTEGKNVVFGVDCIYTIERAKYPDGQGDVCFDIPEGTNQKLDCATGVGTASFITGSYGFAQAAICVKRILEKCQEKKV